MVKYLATTAYCTVKNCVYRQGDECKFSFDYLKTNGYIGESLIGINERCLRYEDKKYQTQW
jgi:hypothetical protein